MLLLKGKSRATVSANIKTYRDVIRQVTLFYWDGVLACEVPDGELMLGTGRDRADRDLYIESMMPRRLEDSRLWC